MSTTTRPKLHWIRDLVAVRARANSVACGLTVACALIATPLLAVDGTGLASVWGTQGSTTSVPIVILDSSFTALGIDTGTGRQIQGWSISVELSDPSLVSSVAFGSSGVTNGLTPIFETTAADTGGTRYTWIVAFDEASNPVPFTLDVGDTVGRIQLGIAPDAPIGSVLNLILDAQLTALSNQGGAIVLTENNGGLALLDGAVQVEETPIFFDGFESGNTSAWANTVP